MPTDMPVTERLSPEDELELVELGVKEAALDEELTMFDPTEPPKAPHPREEAVTDIDGSRLVDVQKDTPRVDDFAQFDLSFDDLHEIDLP